MIKVGRVNKNLSQLFQNDELKMHIT